eukprot:1123992-Alexandrium_andersonii.AAC.1
MSTINTLEVERTRIIDPLIERWLARPLDLLGRFAGPGAALDPLRLVLEDEAPGRRPPRLAARLPG